MIRGDAAEYAVEAVLRHREPISSVVLPRRHLPAAGRRSLVGTVSKSTLRPDLDILAGEKNRVILARPPRGLVANGPLNPTAAAAQFPLLRLRLPQSGEEIQFRLPCFNEQLLPSLVLTVQVAIDHRIEGQGIAHYLIEEISDDLVVFRLESDPGRCSRYPHSYGGVGRWGRRSN
ncbi:unnamed protein product [Linum tenue]|uniref:Uncharacterized protein n=1 Tax=Linum tenue TaxID=586396 RepID=A0AAV0NNH9_9ROSI|nr:unnamed protein product [Linum tenue]